MFRSQRRAELSTAFRGTSIMNRTRHLPGSSPGKEVHASKWSPCQTTTVFGKSRSEEHTSELQSLMRISYAVFCLKKKKKNKQHKNTIHITVTPINTQHNHQPLTL